MAPRSRTTFAWILAAAVLLAMVPVVLVVWIEGDGADGGALDALVAASPVLPGARVGDDGAQAGALPAAMPVTREAQVLHAGPAFAEPTPGSADADAWGPRLAEAGDFDGVPRAWLAPLVLRGRVVDPAGASLAGAAVRYLPDEATAKLVRLATGREPLGQPAVRTDADGRFTLHVWRGIGATEVHGADAIDRRSLRFLVLVDDPRCAVAVRSRAGFIGRECDLGTITTEPGATVQGRVVDEAGRPLEGVAVTFHGNPVDRGTQRDEDRREFHELPADLRRAVTDASGRYTFRSVWPGRGSVGVANEGWLRLTLQLPAWEAGERVHAPDLVATRGATLAGRVLDASGRPVEGARAAVAVGGPITTSWSRRAAWERLLSSAPPRGVLTDAEGRFELPGLKPEGEFNLMVGAAGMAPQVFNKLRPRDAGPEIRLQPVGEGEFPVEVVVVDEAGTPLTGARLHITARTLSNDLERSVEPLSGGRFLVHAQHDDTLTALVMAPGCATTRIKGERLPSAPTWRIALAPESRVEGSVVTESGAPVPGASVRLLPDGEKGEAVGVAQALTDAEGRFSIGGLRAGNWVPSVVGQHVVTAPLPALNAGTAQHLRDVLLSVRGAGSVRGTIRYRDGSVPEEFGGPFEGFSYITLTPQEASGAARDTWTVAPWSWADSEGRYSFSEVASGRYVLSTEFGTETPVEIRAGESAELHIVVPYWALVRGIVLAAGVPVSGATVKHEGLHGRKAREAGIIVGGMTPEAVTTGADGRFELFTPFSGEYAFFATANGGGRSAEVVAGLAPGTEHDITLQLDSGRIEGRVLDAATGNGVPRAQIWLDGAGRTTGDAEGRFALVHVPPGEHALFVRAPDFLGLRREAVRLGAGASVSDLTIPLMRAASVRVTVTGADGLAARDGTRVVAWRADGVPLPNRPAWREALVKDGAALLAGLDAGHFWIGATVADVKSGAAAPSLEQQVPDRVPATLAPGDALAITLQLAPPR